MRDRVLETGRMFLCRMEMDDVDNLMGIFSDPEAMRYYPTTKSWEEAEGWVRWVRDSYEENGFGLYAAIVKESGEFAGQCGLVPQEVEGEREIEISYLFLRKLWGKGLATEAATAFRDYGFERLDLDRVVSLIDPANLASRRVAEKVGMTLDRRIEKWNKTICVYAVDRGTWKAISKIVFERG